MSVRTEAGGYCVSVAQTIGKPLITKMPLTAFLTSYNTAELRRWDRMSKTCRMPSSVVTDAIRGSATAREHTRRSADSAIYGRHGTGCIQVVT